MLVQAHFLASKVSRRVSHNSFVVSEDVNLAEEHSLPLNVQKE